MVSHISDLQRLQALTKGFVQAIIGSTKKMPYGMRYIASETLAALRVRIVQSMLPVSSISWQVKFPHETPEKLAASVGRLIYYHFINTAIVYDLSPKRCYLSDQNFRTPETFDIVHNTVGPLQRKNLAAISKLLTQIASGVPFANEDISLVPLN